MVALLKLIPKQVVIYIAIAVISLGVGAFGGYTFCKRAQYKGVIKQADVDAVKVLEHQAKKDVIDKEVETNVDELKKIPDATGCLDKPDSPEYLNGLQRADSVAKSFLD